MNFLRRCTDSVNRATNKNLEPTMLTHCFVSMEIDNTLRICSKLKIKTLVECAKPVQS